MSDSRIRIAHIIGSLSYGGAENQVVRILNGLNDSKYLKHLVTLSYKRQGQENRVAPGIIRYTVGERRFKKLLRLAKYLRMERIQIVQTHMHGTNLLGTLAAAIARVPVVVTTEHSRDTEKTQFQHLAERFLISKLASIRVTVSRDIRDILIAKDGVPPHKVIVIPNGVEIPGERDSAHDSQKPLIGSVGRLVPEKDYGALIMAVKRVIAKRPNSRLLLVGDGEQRTMLQGMVDDLQLSPNVQFTGWQSDVSKYLDQMDLFVLSSITEGIPVALLEAMARGLPVVATNVGGIPEVIQDRVEGLLVDPRQPEKLADAIIYLLEHSDMAVSFGKAARARIIESFSVTKICREYEYLYERLLSKVQVGIRT